jgi:IstB-like ATP binding protein
VLDRIRRTLVGLKMPRALEVLDQTMRQLERGETSALEVIDTLFAEELTLRENRRVKMALRMAKLSTIKTLAGFDFSFRPSLDRSMKSSWASARTRLRNEVIHFLGPPGTDGGQIAGWELTGTCRASKDGSHGQTPHLQHRIQASGRPGIHCGRDPACAGEAPRPYQ